jgi:hypothetical protein
LSIHHTDNANALYFIKISYYLKVLRKTYSNYLAIALPMKYEIPYEFIWHLPISISMEYSLLD